MARARATNRADASIPIPRQPVLDAKPTSTQPSPDPRSTTRSDLSTPTPSIRRSTTIPGAGRHGARQTVQRSTTSTPSSPVTRQRGTTRPAKSSPTETALTGFTCSTESRPARSTPRHPGIHHRPTRLRVPRDHPRRSRASAGRQDQRGPRRPKQHSRDSPPPNRDPQDPHPGTGDPPHHRLHTPISGIHASVLIDQRVGHNRLGRHVARALRPAGRNRPLTLRSTPPSQRQMPREMRTRPVPLGP